MSLRGSIANNTYNESGGTHAFDQADEVLLQPPACHLKIKPPVEHIGTLKLAMRDYLRDGAPSLELAADIAGLSARTLQRHLAEDDLNYRELLTELRYETAIDLMPNTDNSIIDIASLPGYSDPTHFARTFRRMAGVSPREYQRQLHE